MSSKSIIKTSQCENETVLQFYVNRSQSKQQYDSNKVKINERENISEKCPLLNKNEKFNHGRFT